MTLTRFGGLAVATIILLGPIGVAAAEPASESFTLNGAIVGPTETIPAASEQFRFVPDSLATASQAQSERYALESVSSLAPGGSEPEQSPLQAVAADQSGAASGRSATARPKRMFALVDPSWSGELLLALSVVLIAGGLELAYLGRRSLMSAHHP
jgi:hypothetical protein